MVNHGRSTGCATCRQRKIKCDESRPSCTQCVKSKRQCAGYRSKDPPPAAKDPPARAGKLNGTRKKHVPSTEDVPKKKKERGNKEGKYEECSIKHDSVKVREFERTPLSPAESNIIEESHPDAQDLIAWYKPSDNAVPFTILSPIFPNTDDIVSAYFKENFFTPDPTGMTGQLSGTENASSVLHQALLSLGTLSIANNHGDYHDTQRARQRYGIALRYANASLRNECTATNDDTLSGILLLAMFECLDCWNNDNIDQWSNHIKGAFQLMRMRDRKVDSTAKPRSLMFYRIRSLFTIICLYRNIPVPHEAKQWSYEYEDYDTEGLPSTYVKQPYIRVIMTIADNLCGLQAAIRANAITDMSVIVNALSKIDEDLHGWANPASDPEYSYDPAVDSLDEADAVWQGVYHVYKDHTVYMTYYHYRNVRMYNSLLLSLWLSRSGAPLHSSELLRLMDERIMLVDEILHGLPWRLNYRRLDSNGEPVQSKHAPPVMWGFTSMWALVFACEALCHESSILVLTSGREEFQDLKIRAAAQIQWAAGRLEYINRRNGIRQAAVFADHFRNVWDEVTRPMQYFDSPQSLASFGSGTNYIVDLYNGTGFTRPYLKP